MAQPQSPPRGFFSWREDLNQIDRRIGAFEDRLGNLEGTVVRAPTLHLLNDRFDTIEARLKEI